MCEAVKAGPWQGRGSHSPTVQRAHQIDANKQENKQIKATHSFLHISALRGFLLVHCRGKRKQALRVWKVLRLDEEMMSREMHLKTILVRSP